MQAQGGRPFQEDRCTFVPPDQFPANTEHRLALFAVYDGQWVLSLLDYSGPCMARPGTDGYCLVAPI